MLDIYNTAMKMKVYLQSPDTLRPKKEKKRKRNSFKIRFIFGVIKVMTM